MSSSLVPEYTSVNDMFRVLQEYQQLNFSYFLKQLLAERNIGITDLYKMLIEHEYYLSLESLYRYFNPNPRTNRFPPQYFVQIFAEVLQLTEKEAKILLLFWKHWQLVKKCNCL